MRSSRSSSVSEARRAIIAWLEREGSGPDVAARLRAEAVGLLLQGQPDAADAVLRVVLATVHIPLADVPAAITMESLLAVIRLTARSLPRFGITSPRLAVAGLGIVLLPDRNMGGELRAKRLLPVLADYEPVPGSTPVYAVYSPSPYPAPKIRAFVEVLREALQAGEETPIRP